jgi:flagellum-specific peptidoglycan hydrolase FlgJ
LTAQQLQFLLRVTPAAIESQRKYEIPACVTVAQAILESATAAGWGSSSLFRLANNPFGIKYCHLGSGHPPIGSSAHGPIGSSPAPGTDDRMSRSTNQPIPQDYGAFDALTWEIENGQKKFVTAQFQCFPNLDAAFAAHALLLRGPRYRPAFAWRGDWKQFAERLGPKTSPLDMEHCGYSTNPSYSAELIKIVNLYRLDDPRALQWFATGQDPGVRAIEPSDQQVIGKENDRSSDESLKP